MERGVLCNVVQVRSIAADSSLGRIGCTFLPESRRQIYGTNR